MYSSTLRNKCCAIVLILSLLTLKVSAVLASRQQIPSDLRSASLVSFAGAMRETNDGVHFRLNRVRAQATFARIFFPMGQNGTEFIQVRDVLSAMLVLRAVIPVLNLAADGDISPTFPPNTVSRK